MFQWRKTAAVALCFSVAGSMFLAPMARATGEPTPPPVPPNLEVEEGNQPFLLAHAAGTQNYICLAKNKAWTFIGPQATLFDDESGQILTHFLSPNPSQGGVARAT